MKTLATIVAAFTIFAAPAVAQNGGARPANHRSLCWVDYCPCVQDRDYGGADPAICRILRAGGRVDSDQMAAAAAARDARRQIRRFRESGY